MSDKPSKDNLNEIPKTYSSQDIEGKWYRRWNQSGCFSPTIDPKKKPFTLLIPPPNVTGILHMGHVLNNTLQDVAVRYHRMTGRPTLWLPGVDHAGIATQNVVEKELAKEGKTRHDLGREELVAKIWRWKEEKGGRIIEQLKQLGCSCDWSRERFTMDEGLSRAVREVFVHLYEKDLIYKGKYIINWCPRCVTALANDEVEHTDEQGKLWHMRYPLADGKGHLVVATTRPETMLGDTAVAVNPRDERYAHLIGKMVALPFTGRQIPVIADEHVDPEFGTGCVKVTPAHDPNDFEIGARHDLPRVLAMDEHGVMNAEAGEQFEGLDRYDCRKKIVAMLEENGLLEKIEDHEHSVGRCYRCETVIEPYLSDQWFVRMKPLAAPAIDVVNDGQVRFVPDRWTKVYLHWMENVRDWCISRQIWWGHRIPAWYCDACGEIAVSVDDISECPKCGGALRQDEDVLDTWFSSWLWPFSTMGWPERTADLEYFLPTNLLITAYGIIYLWVARMIMGSLEFMDKIPFDTVLIHGMVLDEQGRKMSKSLGNSPDPIHIIEEVGADALRFSIVFNAPRGQDSVYSATILDNGRNFANKIWNAYRFIMMGTESIEGLPKPTELRLELADRWIYSRLHAVTRDVTAAYRTQRYSEAAAMLQDFIWRQYCSWYLELAKERIYNAADKVGQRTAKYILLDVLQSSMRLLHPIMPFITEEIWQRCGKRFPTGDDMLITARFPVADESRIDPQIDADMALIQETISSIRNLRKQVNIKPGLDVEIHIRTARESQNDLIEQYGSYFTKLARVSDMFTGVGIVKPKRCIGDVVQELEVFLPLSGLVDVDAELARLQKQAGKLEQEVARLEKKLNNANFIERAPDVVVEKERAKLDEAAAQLAKLQVLIADMT
ncbi:MAG: valine--tRNA ligase [Candidatus Cloacimonetes bacterium]|nr:valine--tRNA ligase [Candidatus Cloacimonadota bacterium]